MKNMLLIIALLCVCACTVGDFPENRVKLHDMGKDICQTQPEKCINGVPW